MTTYRLWCGKVNCHCLCWMIRYSQPEYTSWTHKVLGRPLDPKHSAKDQTLRQLIWRLVILVFSLVRSWKRHFDHNQCNISYIRNETHGVLFKFTSMYQCLATHNAWSKWILGSNDLEIVWIAFSLFQLSDPEIAKIEIDEINEMRVNPF